MSLLVRVNWNVHKARLQGTIKVAHFPGMMMNTFKLSSRKSDIRVDLCRFPSSLGLLREFQASQRYILRDFVSNKCIFDVYNNKMLGIS